MLKNGEILQKKISNEHGNNSDVQVIRMGMQNKATGQLYSRLVPLVLLLVDGSNPIDVTDPSWEMYLIIKKAVDHSGNDQDRVVGFSAVYRFYCYPNGLRLQLGQILVLPPYQQKGYGRYLLEVLNDVAVKEEVYDITIEKPVEKLQHLRTCIDVSRFLNFDPIQNAVNATSSQLQHGKISKKAYIPRFLPPSNVVEDIRSIFKACVKDYFAVVSNRVRVDILGKDSETSGKKVIEVPSEHDPDMSFVMFRSTAGGGCRDGRGPGQARRAAEAIGGGAGKVHGSLARAGKVRGQTPKVAKQDKKKKPRGRAHKRMQYNRRFVTAVDPSTAELPEEIQIEKNSKYQKERWYSGLPAVQTKRKVKPPQVGHNVVQPQLSKLFQRQSPPRKKEREIYGTPNGHEEAEDTTREFKHEEITATIKDFDEPGTLAPTELHLEGTKYMVIQGEPGAVISWEEVGIYEEQMTPGQCNMFVERLGDYLIQQGL
ncbi:hypothetical protein SAY87_005632 [Trapa incisa]|uniref:N-acetyltransferase domain-containing protein n=1 Tax=Trapa incisa TaxID=236973 RepID=A0AAN7K950_9MYRT|nr:hypothetical protein SAY87_005632 [Trapa incisa]